MKPGLSGLVRLKNEEAWCRLALESFVGWCDELIIVLNAPTDRTPRIVREFVANHPGKSRVFDYPHEIWPLGPGHDRIPDTDPRASAAFYNFTQAQAAYSHAVKLDGDMVMMDWAGAEIRRLMAAGHHRIKFEGTDLVGDELRHIGCHPRCPTNGVYQLGKGVRYVQGATTQNLKGVPEPTHIIARPTFVHMKWARKSFAASIMQWPENWQQIEHFRQVAERRHPVAPYTGEYPSSVRALLT